MQDKFPGFDACIEMMRKRSPQTQEEGFHLLRPHAGEYVDELMREFQREQRHGLRCWLIELIGEAKAPKAFPLLVDCLRGNDESLRLWAIYGLKNLDTKEARRVLWEARSYTFATEQETHYFRQELERISAQR